MKNSFPWYKNGLYFTCTGCGKCCTGSPGYVWITQEESLAIANYLGLPLEEFLKKYTRSIFGRLSLREDQINYDCVFLKDNKCQIYEVRPKQCRTFPWWKENLSSEKAWKNLRSYCEGVDHTEAPLVPFDTIEKEKTS